MIEAVIFDFDATLVDSEPNYFEAEKRMLADFGKPDLTMEDKKKYIGMGGRAVVEAMMAAYNICEPVERLMELKGRYYMEIARQNTPVFPEMRKLLQLLSADKYPLAVASGTPREILQELLQLTGLAGYFAAVLSSDQVAHGKPAPDLFLKTAVTLGVAPEKCVVFEDSRYGVQAAKAAGMACVAVPYLLDEELDESFLAADYLFRGGISEFSADEIYSWIKNR